MKSVQYTWNSDGKQNTLKLVQVQGTSGRAFLFGNSNRKPIEIRTFFLATVQVTQALWEHVMGSGSNPSCRRGAQLPVENVSWDQLTGTGGFLHAINASPILDALDGELEKTGRILLRLPSEAEW